MRWAVMIGVTSLVLSGCLGSTMSWSIAGPGSGQLEYHFRCTGDPARVDFRWDINTVGRLTIRVLDASGAEVFERRYSGSTDVDEKVVLEGASGTWDLQLDRGSGYDGKMELDADCQW